MLLQQNLRKTDYSWLNFLKIFELQISLSIYTELASPYTQMPCLTQDIAVAYTK